MPQSLSHFTHSSPMNSLSATRHAMLSRPNRRMNRCMISILSSQLELPLLSSSLNNMGNATFLYVMPMTRAFMFSSPNFQLVLSIDSTYGPFSGKSFITTLATMSRFRTVCAMNRWMRRMLESFGVLLSKAEASFEKFTVWTLHMAQTSWDRHLIRARFIKGLKWDRRTDNKSLLLWWPRVL